MALDALLRVLREETDREERRLAEEAAREAARILEEARAAAARARAAALERVEREAEARLAGVRSEARQARARARLLEGRRQLEALREAAAAALPPLATPAVAGRLAAELLAEAGPGPAVLVVDPGCEAAAAAAAAARALGREAEVRIRTVPSARGGVELESGRLVLDATIAARLERAWPIAEPALARALLGDGVGEEAG